MVTWLWRSVHGMFGLSDDMRKINVLIHVTRRPEGSGYIYHRIEPCFLREDEERAI